MPLQRLIYISRVATAMSAAELQRLQALSERHNRRQDITGALGHTGRYFIQCIEGRHNAITEVMARIRTDPRHTDMLDLCSIDTDKRLFGQWSMRLFDSHALDDDVHLTHQAGQRDPDRAKLLIDRMTQALQPGQTLHRL